MARKVASSRGIEADSDALQASLAEGTGLGGEEGAVGSEREVTEAIERRQLLNKEGEVTTGRGVRRR